MLPRNGFGSRFTRMACRAKTSFSLLSFYHRDQGLKIWDAVESEVEREVAPAVGGMWDSWAEALMPRLGGGEHFNALHRLVQLWLPRHAPDSAASSGPQRAGGQDRSSLTCLECQDSLQVWFLSSRVTSCGSHQLSTLESQQVLDLRSKLADVEAKFYFCGSRISRN